MVTTVLYFVWGHCPRSCQGTGQFPPMLPPAAYVIIMVAVLLGVHFGKAELVGRVSSKIHLLFFVLKMIP